MSNPSRLSFFARLQQPFAHYMALLLTLSLALYADRVLAAETTLLLAPLRWLPSVSVELSAAELAALKQRQVLRLGVGLGEYEPLEVIRGNSLKGITVDYLSMLSASLNLNIEVRTYPNWPAALAALQSGEIDVLGRGSSYEAQLPGVVLSMPYAANETVLLTRTDLPEYTWHKPLGEVALVGGYIPSALLTERYPDAQPLLYDSVRDALHAVEYQRTQWFIGDTITAAYQLASGELPNLRMHSLYGWGEQGFSFVMRDADAPLRDLFDRVLAAVPQLTQANILEHWGVKGRFGTRQKTTFTIEEQQWLDSAPEVRVVISGSSSPYGFYDEDGRFRGLLADILNEISQRTGLHFNFVERTSLNDLMLAMREDDADMTLMLLPNAEREQFLRFTQPYMSNSFVLIAPPNSAPKTIAQMHNKRLAILKNSLQKSILTKQHPDIKWLEVDNYVDSLVAVVDGKADAAVLAFPIARYLVDCYFSDELQIASSIPILRADLPIAVRKDMPLLFSVLEKTLDELEPSVVGNLLERWQGLRPVEERVWGGYVNLLRWVSIGGGTVLCLLLLWLIYAYIRQKKLRDHANILAFRSALLDGIPQSIAVRDLQGHFVLCNQEFYKSFMVRPEQVLGRGTAQLPGLADGQAQALEENYFALLAKGAADLQKMEIDINGQHMFFQQWTIPYKEHDQAAGLVMGWIDITSSILLQNQLQIMRDQAVEASDAKSRFLAVMSHEIRTPLNAIIGLLELAMRRVDQGGEWDREGIEVAYASSQSLLLLIGDILDLAKIEAGKLVLEPQRFEPQVILESVTRVFHGVARQKGLYLLTEQQAGPNYTVFLDAGRLKQILSNLLSNAIKFTDRGGVNIRLSSQKLGVNLHLVFEITDSGIGISADDQAQLFEPFSQAKGQTNLRGGTGLGLAICRQLVAMMGGKLQLDSKLKIGTCVRVSVVAPIISDAPSESIDKAPALAQQHRPEALHVLLVDDHPANRLLLEQQLVFLGHSVCEAENGKQAIVLLANQSFDVIITDCNMPIMGGYELTRKVREVERGGQVSCRIIGFTANAQPDEYQRCIDAGMDDCLFKPVGLDALARCLGGLTAQPYIAAEPAVNEILFDLDMVEQLTGGDSKSLSMLLNQLRISNGEDLHKLAEAIAAGHWRDQGQLVHRIKGAARMVGAHSLANAAQAYEDGVVKALTDSELKYLAQGVLSAMQELQAVVHDWLSAHG